MDTFRFRRLALLAGFAFAATPAWAQGHVDVHDHLTFGSPRPDFVAAASVAVAEMAPSGVGVMLVMPPPQTVGQRGVYGLESLLPAVAAHPGRLAALGGGGTLNVMIQEAVAAGATSADLRRRFAERAREIAALGAVGFGEMTAEHFSFSPHHPYVAAPPDHELFLLLADIAAETGLPIDLHMEAVAAPFTFSSRLRANPATPAQAEPNLAAFERLLAHNRGAAIVWAHAGWDNTGVRTTALMAALMARHPNLYLSLRMPPPRGPQLSVEANRPLDGAGRLRADWLDLITAFPDRAMIGGDEFFAAETRGRPNPSVGGVALSATILDQLPDDLRAAVGWENAMRVYHLDHH